MLVAFMFPLFIIFLFMFFVLTIFPDLTHMLPDLDAIDQRFITYPSLVLNLSVATYLIYYFAALENYPHRVYLIMFFGSFSMMLGSSVSLAFEARIPGLDILRFVFNDGLGAAFVVLVATFAAGWSAKKFHASVSNQ